MDNDIKVVRVAKTIARKFKFRLNYLKYQIISPKLANEIIANAIKIGSPYMVARGGAVELRCIGEYLKSGTFTDTMREEIQTCAGVFPTNDVLLKKFCQYYLQCMEAVDLLALWGVGAEKHAVASHCSSAKFTELEALEPYYYTNPWSSALAGKRVLVVHPFVESIKNQYARRERLFEDKTILPEFKSLEVVQAVQSNAGEITKYDDWFEALNYMQNEIKEKEFDVAIIGAGAYSLPLAAYVKSIGKVAIQMSGATQILFGIKGKRWENIPEVSKLFNNYWIRPSEKETPKGNKKVEGGSYW